MSKELEKLKAKLEDFKKKLNNPEINTDEQMQSYIESGIELAKKEIADLEKELGNKVEDANAKVEEAEKKVESAETKEEKKEAQAEVKDAKAEVKEAKEEVKEVEKLADNAEKVEEKVEEVKAEAKEEDKKGSRPKIEKMKSMSRAKIAAEKAKADRVRQAKEKAKALKEKTKRKASKPTKIKKPKGVDVKPLVSKRMAKKIKAAKKTTRLEKEKSVRAFGQVVKYRNDAEFCKKLIQALKKRRSASKKDGKRRKTKPVFGVIVSGTKNIVHKALNSVSEKEIQKNPKQFLAKAQRLEKSAIRFLEDFKSILGSDYKKSEITSEFGELEKYIKSFVERIKKK